MIGTRSDKRHRKGLRQRFRKIDCDREKFRASTLFGLRQFTRNCASISRENFIRIVREPTVSAATCIYTARFRPNTFHISKELAERKRDTDSCNRICWKLLKNNSPRTRKNRTLATGTRTARDLVLPLN